MIIPTTSQDLPPQRPTDPLHRQDEPLFRAIFEQAAVGVAQIETATGRFVRVNQRYCEIVGVTNEEMMATTFMAITYPEDLQADLDNMEALKAGRIREFTMEKRYVRADGSIVWVDLTVSPLWDIGEQPSFYIAVVQDITERKQVETLLEADKCILELIASGAPLTGVLDRLCRLFEDMSPDLDSSVLLMDHERLRHGAAPSLPPTYCTAIDGIHIGPNAGSCGTAAYLQQRVIVVDIAHDPLWADYRKIALKHHLRACWSAPIFSEDRSVLGTFAMYYRESRSPSAYELKISEHATELAAIAIERAQAEEAMRESEQFSKVVLDSLSAYVAVLDRAGAIVAVNRAWQRSAADNDPLGSSQIGVGVNYLEVCRRASTKDRAAQQTLRGIQAVLSQQTELFETEYVCLTSDGRRWFSMRVTPLGGRDGGAVVAHEDITARKRAEEAVRESYYRLQTVSREVQMAEERERSRLSRELHDEFGQLLSVLKFTLSTTERDLRKRSVNTFPLARQVKGTMETVDQLFVSLHRMVAALRPAVLEQLGLIVAIRALATDVVTPSGVRCRVIVKQKGLPKTFPPAVEGALYRITQELMTNIVRHAKATAATITVSCAEGKMKLVVQDNGQGFRVDTVRSKGRFGLQGIRERVELLGGTVEIHSRPGMTTATVCVPLGGSSFGKATTVSSQASIRSKAKKKRRYAQVR